MAVTSYKNGADTFGQDFSMPPFSATSEGIGAGILANGVVTFANAPEGVTKVLVFSTAPVIVDIGVVPPPIVFDSSVRLAANAGEFAVLGVQLHNVNPTSGTEAFSVRALAQDAYVKIFYYKQ